MSIGKEKITHYKWQNCSVPLNYMAFRFSSPATLASSLLTVDFHDLKGY